MKYDEEFMREYQLFIVPLLRRMPFSISQKQSNFMAWHEKPARLFFGLVSKNPAATATDTATMTAPTINETFFHRSTIHRV